MTRAPEQSRPTQAPEAGLRISRVKAADRLAAADRLVAAVRENAGQEFLDAARAFSIDLTHFWASSWAGQISQVALGVSGAGRTATCFTSRPESRQASNELARVLDALCRGMDEARLAQALLEGEDELLRAAYLEAGFAEIARLSYLRRPVKSDKGLLTHALQKLDPGLELVPYDPSLDDEVVAALERTYIETLDCPKLCGMRDSADVLASHKATGSFDPKLWWLLRSGGTGQGVMLFNPCPDQDVIELVYLGLSPELRGRGLARRLLSFGIRQLTGRAQRHVACAVDDRNVPARKLYESFGFQPFSGRLALVRALPVGATDASVARD